MKYFTPELFVRLQNLADQCAASEWDRAGERYSVALQKNLGRFPAALRKLAEERHLHDAEVVCVSQIRDKLVITLEPEQNGDRLIVLTYKLLADPEINPSAIPEQHRTEYVAWLCDEVSLGRPLGKVRAPVYRHDILLSNGSELRLRFRLLKVTRPQRLLAAQGQSNGELRSA